jgi:predicted Rossmann-fold nucleotide-binding protein
MSEFVEGFEKMSRIGPCVSIFGSARTKPENKYYKLAEDIAFKLVQRRLRSYYWWRTGYYGSGKQRSKSRWWKIGRFKH